MGGAVNSCIDFTNKYPAAAGKWVVDKTITPLVRKVADNIDEKFKKTSVYEAYRKGIDLQSVDTMKQ